MLEFYQAACFCFTHPRLASSQSATISHILCLSNSILDQVHGWIFDCHEVCFNLYHSVCVGRRSIMNHMVSLSVGVYLIKLVHVMSSLQPMSQSWQWRELVPVVVHIAGFITLAAPLCTLSNCTTVSVTLLHAKSTANVTELTMQSACSSGTKW